MINEEKSFIAMCKFLLWLFTALIISFIGISGVFADTTIDTSQFINTTGRKWSAGSLEFASGPTFNNDWLLNAYNVTGGIYTPPNSYDYIEFSYFEHNSGTFNPCNSSGKFTAEFKLLFTSATFNQYVSSIKWNDDTCSIQERNQDGTMKISCVASPSSSNSTGIYVNYNDIQGTATSSLYISRNIDITCGLNTEALINNNNANTQDIMNNQNQNADKIIEENRKNFQVCNQKEYGEFSHIGMSLQNGSRMYNINNNVSSVTFDVTKYRSKTITLYFDLSNSNTPRTNYCVAQIEANNNRNYCLSASYSTSTSTSASYSITIPSNANYIYAYGYVNNSRTDIVDQIWIENPECVNILEENEKTSKGILGKLKDLFNFFNNDDVDSETTTDTLDDLSSTLPTNSVISDLLLLPVRLLQSIVNSIGGTCTSFNLGSLYDTNLILPCINLETYLGSSIWTFIDVVFSGVFILVIRKKFIQIFENITNLRNGGNEVE